MSVFQARPPQTGWVPGSYFETPTEYYKQRRRTREVGGADLKMTEEQESIMKRECVEHLETHVMILFSQVYHDLLRSEEEFVGELRHAIENYLSVFDDPSTPEAIRNLKEDLSINLRELYNFHAKCSSPFVIWLNFICSA
jgi:hypothetical protein